MTQIPLSLYITINAIIGLSISYAGGYLYETHLMNPQSGPMWSPLVFLVILGLYALLAYYLVTTGPLKNLIRKQDNQTQNPKQ